MSFQGTSPHPLATRRKALHLTLRGLAQITGIVYVRIHALEHNAEPRAGELEKLAAALGCEVADLQREVPR